MSTVSFVCTTYRRATCVERILAQYHRQTYPHKELILFNTDMEYPITLEHSDPTIHLVNNGTDYETGAPYTNRGAICRDALVYATGEYFMLADDDDIYLPWHLQQAVDNIQSSGRDAWKPHKSFFATGNKVELCRNTMEASIIVKMSRIRQLGFRTDITGYEGVGWYMRLRDEGHIQENFTHHVPSYCFNWADPAEIGGHKQSSTIDAIDNFERHKRDTKDIAVRPLRSDVSLTALYAPLYTFYRANIGLFDSGLLRKYVKGHI